MKPVDVRDELVRALELDLVGPIGEHPLARETLAYAPSRWYLTGFLVSTAAPDTQSSETGGDEEVDAATEGAGTDDDVAPEPRAARRVFFPSSIGISVLVPQGIDGLDATVSWGDYRYVEAAGDQPPTWSRSPQQVLLHIPLGPDTGQPAAHNVPQSRGLTLMIAIRTISGGPESRHGCGLPAGTRSVSVFLVNNRESAPDDRPDEGFVFQSALELKLESGFIPRPDLRGASGDDWDERVAGLQYRDVCEHAVGHGVATRSRIGEDGRCRSVSTSWIPSAEVEKVEPCVIEGVELGMEALAGITSVGDVRNAVGELVPAYERWILGQRKVLPADKRYRDVAEKLLKQADFARQRISAGLDVLAKPDVLEAFRIANRVMARAARQRKAHLEGVAPDTLAPPRWRPFQLAFLLMNLPGLEDPLHADRDRVDLLFFPTGGGKTEAYLGLAAFTMVLRRLRHPGVQSAGLSVLMRYTMRLLTLDQLGRAATMICALELERVDDIEKLGPWPFEIGLWVGKAATPNRMGEKGDKSDDTARARTIAYKNNSAKAPPIPLEECPWCGTRFTPHSFELTPNQDRPTDLRIVCVARRCAFNRDRALPIVTIDEPLFQRVPTFVIATVDKFANLPWVGRSGALSGKVDRHDRSGFYGPCDPSRGHPLDAPLLPPDLIIQDELHLISGPLGTMVGLYETALDALSSRTVGGREVRPKIVASTATVRRAEVQIRALFARPLVETFPPPGPDRRDSFFARTVPTGEKRGRLYIGMAAQGRSPKVILMRVYLALLAGAQRAYEAHGGSTNRDNPADPYMTLLGYFNNLRELGGSRRLVEDEVRSRLSSYARRMRVGEARGSFVDRKIAYEPLELTSRARTSEVADAKRRLALPFQDKEHVDVALATNMISVGLDITRLGLMVVLGQPKTAAEYIQSTSRVGRDDEKPGLVVTLLNTHRPRDRSHYERFEAFHASFYRAVEATSVTPFSPRALDRGLPGVLVSLARLLVPELTPPLGAGRMRDLRPKASLVSEALASRAARHARLTAEEAEELRRKVKTRAEDLLDEWAKIAHAKYQVGAELQYGTEWPGAPNLLYQPLDTALLQQPPGAQKFKAHRSLRDVEPSVNLWVKYLDDTPLEGDDE